METINNNLDVNVISVQSLMFTYFIKSNENQVNLYSTFKNKPELTKVRASKLNMAQQQEK